VEERELACPAANPIMTVQRLQMTNEIAKLESTVSKPVCNEHRCFNADARRRQHCILQPSLDRRSCRTLHRRQLAKQRVQQPPLSFCSMCNACLTPLQLPHSPTFRYTVRLPQELICPVSTLTDGVAGIRASPATATAPRERLSRCSGLTLSYFSMHKGTRRWAYSATLLFLRQPESRALQAALRALYNLKLRQLH
jgi:hypothetical protein